MITRLQNFFLKHNKWLFGGLLIVIIVTFVLTIGPQSFFGSGGAPQRESLQYYGYDLTSESDQRAMVQTAEVSAIFHPELQVRREQLMDLAYLRVAGLGIAGQLGIPQPTKEDLADYVETLQVFQNPQTGEFSPEAYQSMINAMQSSERFNRDIIGRVLREDFRIMQVRSALGGPDYALPYELEREYIDRQTSYDLALAHFDYAGFEPEIEPTEEELQQFFNENPARYEIPERISVTALLFNSEAYLDEVSEPTEETLQAYFNANKSRYEPDQEATDTERDNDVEIAEETPELTLADVREAVIQDWKTEQAKKIAAKKSEQFSLRLWQQSIALNSEAFESLIDEFKVETRNLPPYSRNQPPRIPFANVQILNSMWIYANNPSRYFSDIGQTPDGAILLVNRGVTESRMPEFEEVRERVIADYKVSEKRRLFAERGKELRDTVQSRLGEESFEDIVADLGLVFEDVESFTGENVPNELMRSTAWDQARFLDEDAVSEMVLQAEKGTFVFVQNKTVPEVDTESEGFQAFLEERSNFLSDAMGWARLREITDKSLATLLGPNEGE